MSVHQLKDGRWIVQYYRDYKPKREYFGRGDEAKQEALKRSDVLSLTRNMAKFNLEKAEFSPQVGVYLHKDGRWFVQYQNPMNGNKIKREYFGRGIISKQRAASRKNEIMRGEFYKLEKNIIRELCCDLRDELRTKKIRVEVKTNAGNIDVESPLHIIEVKNIMEWKAAIGQVMAYGFYCPDKKKRIHLFGKAGERTKKTIMDVCNHLDILVTFYK